MIENHHFMVTSRSRTFKIGNQEDMRRSTLFWKSSEWAHWYLTTDTQMCTSEWKPHETSLLWTWTTRCWVAPPDRRIFVTTGLSVSQVRSCCGWRNLSQFVEEDVPGTVCEVNQPRRYVVQLPDVSSRHHLVFTKRHRRGQELVPDRRWTFLRWYLLSCQCSYSCLLKEAHVFRLVLRGSTLRCTLTPSPETVTWDLQVWLTVCFFFSHPLTFSQNYHRQSWYSNMFSYEQW